MYPNIHRLGGKIFQKNFLCIKTLFITYKSNKKKYFFPIFEGGSLLSVEKFPLLFFLMNPSLPFLNTPKADVDVMIESINKSQNWDLNVMIFPTLDFSNQRLPFQRFRLDEVENQGNYLVLGQVSSEDEGVS